jgi:hypothetical protein
MATPDDYITCRTWGHAWFEYDSNWTPMFGTPVTLRCERCNAERRDTIDGRGNVASRRYLLPESYRYGRGERPSRQDMRLAIIASHLRDRREAKRANRRTDTTDTGTVAAN